MVPVRSFYPDVAAVLADDHLPGCVVRWDAACGGSHTLPLFHTAVKSSATRFT